MLALYCLVIYYYLNLSSILFDVKIVRRDQKSSKTSYEGFYYS